MYQRVRFCSNLLLFDLDNGAAVILCHFRFCSRICFHIAHGSIDSLPASSRRRTQSLNSKKRRSCKETPNALSSIRARLFRSHDSRSSSMRYLSYSSCSRSQSQVIAPPILETDQCSDDKRANAEAHRERPECVFSELAESQRGRDAVARMVRAQPVSSSPRVTGKKLHQ